MQVKFSMREHQKSDEEIFIGEETRTFLADNSISAKSKEAFFVAVRSYYVCSYKYLREKLPTDNDPLLARAEVVDTSLRKSSKFEDLSFFLKRYPILIMPGKFSLFS